MEFAKFHGYGNDYIVIEAERFGASGLVAASDEARASDAAGASDEAGTLSAFVRRICERHYGAGADGVALLSRMTGATRAGATANDTRAGATANDTPAATDGPHPATDEPPAATDETRMTTGETGAMFDEGGATADEAGATADGARATDEAEAHFRVRIFNPDGSEAAMSGNGTRCAAAYLHETRLWTRDELRLATRAGVKLYRLRRRLGEGRYRFEAEIGKPRFESASVPMLTASPLASVRDYALPIGAGETVVVTALEMCNPNCCVFVEDFDALDWRRIGRLVETHAQFPARTNVEFVRVRDRRTIEVRVWERGVGETLSSGTGACASAVAAAFNGLTDRRVSVHMPGGQLEVHWRDDGEALLTGDAELIYRGHWPRAEGGKQ